MPGRTKAAAPRSGTVAVSSNETRHLPAYQSPIDLCLTCEDHGRLIEDRRGQRSENGAVAASNAKTTLSQSALARHQGPSRTPQGIRPSGPFAKIRLGARDLLEKHLPRRRVLAVLDVTGKRASPDGFLSCVLSRSAQDARERLTGARPTSHSGCLESAAWAGISAGLRTRLCVAGEQDRRAFS